MDAWDCSKSVLDGGFWGLEERKREGSENVGAIRLFQSGSECLKQGVCAQAFRQAQAAAALIGCGHRAAPNGKYDSHFCRPAGPENTQRSDHGWTEEAKEKAFLVKARLVLDRGTQACRVRDPLGSGMQAAGT